MKVRMCLLFAAIAIGLGTGPVEAKDAYGVLFRHVMPLRLKRTPQQPIGMIKGGAIATTPKKH